MQVQQTVATATNGDNVGYRGPQVCSVVGITYRQLDYWARTDLLRPSLSDAKGSGSQRRYSYTDLLQLKVIKRLLDSGISLRSARRAIEFLRSAGEDLAAANLVIDEGRAVLARSGEEIIDLLRGGQGVLNIVPLAGVFSELDAAITDMGARTPTAPGGAASEGVAAATGGAPSTGGATAKRGATGA
ncbi:MAG: MerR family transcriptional regulator [Actinomycetota bacterium]|nr:MerR family transcriptional regulator [Actinomycetota bacterium]